MIDVIKQTPEVYSQESRDYQVISRLYTALFNYTKMYIDNMSVWNRDIDNKLTQLRAKTLNFDPLHPWDLDSLEAIVSCFKYLVRTKGTIKALELCSTILIRINNLEGEPNVTVKGNLISIKLPIQLSSVGALSDLYRYLIPAGFTYRIYSYVSLDADVNTYIATSQSAGRYDISTWDMGIYDARWVSSEGSEGMSSEGAGNQGYSIFHNAVIDNGSEGVTLKDDII